MWRVVEESPSRLFGIGEVARQERDAVYLRLTIVTDGVLDGVGYHLVVARADNMVQKYACIIGVHERQRQGLRRRHDEPLIGTRRHFEGHSHSETPHSGLHGTGRIEDIVVG